MKNTKLVFGLLCIGVAMVILFFAFSDGRRQSEQMATSTDSAVGGRTETSDEGGAKTGGKTSGADGVVEQVGTRRVVYTDAGFSPFLVELSAGEEIEFVNKSSGGLWVTTRQHPTAGQQAYEAFDTGRTLKQGEVFVFSFTKVGTWGYKNLNNDAHLGAVVVVPQR